MDVFVRPLRGARRRGVDRRGCHRAGAASPGSRDGVGPLPARHPRSPSPGQSGSSGITTPGSRPTSTARVIAVLPNRSRTLSIAASSATRARDLERQRELDGVGVLEVREREAEQRHALAPRSSASRPRAARARRPAARRRPPVACAERVRARGFRVVLEPQPQHDRLRDPDSACASAGTPGRPARAGRRGRTPGRCGPRARGRAARRSTDHDRPTTTWTGVCPCTTAYRCRPPATSAATRTDWGSVATSPRGRSRGRTSTASSRSPSADAPEHLDRQRVQERLLVGPAAPAGGRPAWPPGTRPSPGTACAPRRP